MHLVAKKIKDLTSFQNQIAFACPCIPSWQGRMYQHGSWSRYQSLSFLLSILWIQFWKKYGDLATIQNKTEQIEKLSMGLFAYKRVIQNMQNNATLGLIKCQKHVNQYDKSYQNRQAKFARRCLLGSQVITQFGRVFCEATPILVSILQQKSDK
jgi:hypothetical protein